MTRSPRCAFGVDGERGLAERRRPATAAPIRARAGPTTGSRRRSPGASSIGRDAGERPQDQLGADDERQGDATPGGRSAAARAGGDAAAARPGSARAPGRAARDDDSGVRRRCRPSASGSARARRHGRRASDGGATITWTTLRASGAGSAAGAGRQRRVGVTSWTDRTMRTTASDQPGDGALRPEAVADDAERAGRSRRRSRCRPRCRDRSGLARRDGPDRRRSADRREDRSVGHERDVPAAVAEAGLDAADDVGLGEERVEPDERLRAAGRWIGPTPCVRQAGRSVIVVPEVEDEQRCPG